MVTTLPNTGIVLPTRSSPGSGLWADALDAALSLIDAHDHSTGKGARVPTAGININGDLTFSSLYAPTNLHRISFASVTALAANNKSIFVSSADNELYWRSNAGTNVKMTLNGALNVAAFTGGIGGDYSAVGAAVAFDDAGDRYTFKQQAPGGWARLACGDVRLFETGTTESLFVGLAAPAALAGSYTITMPLAAPGSTSLVQMDSSGVLTASNATIGGTPNFTGAVTMASTLGVTGAMTALAANVTSNGHRIQLKAPAALAGDYDITMPGALPAATQIMRLGSTGVITAATSSVTRTFNSGFAVASTTGAVFNTGATLGGPYLDFGTSTGQNWLPLSVAVGEVITGWSVRAFKQSATGTISAQLVSLSTSDAETNIGAAASNGANFPGAIALSISGLSTTVVSDASYFINIHGGGTTGDTAHQYQVTVTVT